MYKCSWSIINGLELDISCEVSEEVLANLSNGIYLSGGVVYYVGSSRKQAIELLRVYIKGYMCKCIEEHEKVLEKARNDWKSCR